MMKGTACFLLPPSYFAVTPQSHSLTYKNAKAVKFDSRRDFMFHAASFTEDK